MEYRNSNPMPIQFIIDVILVKFIGARQLLLSIQMQHANRSFNTETGTGISWPFCDIEIFNEKTPFFLKSLTSIISIIRYVTPKMKITDNRSDSLLKEDLSIDATCDLCYSRTMLSLRGGWVEFPLRWLSGIWLQAKT
jgi:hypothetical protein